MVNGAGTVTIYALGIELQVRGAPLVEHAAALDRELNVWATRLQGWLSVLVGGPTGYLWNPGFVSWPSAIGFELQSKAYAEGKFNEPERLSTWGWRHALAHAGNSDDPPLSRVLLAAAVTSEVHGDYRAAVLDAATASELALNKGIVECVRWRGADAQITDELIRNKTLGSLIQLAKTFSLALPPNAGTDLVRVRNRVAHEGYTPVQDDARKAIEVARVTVGSLDPLSAHCDETIPSEGQVE